MPKAYSIEKEKRCNMERLTKVTQYGGIVPYITLCSQEEEDDWHKKCVEKLAQYESFIEQGSLIEPKVKIGQEIYVNNICLREVSPMTVVEIGVTVSSDNKIIQVFRAYDRIDKIYHAYLDDAIGKNVFLSKDEAINSLTEGQK